MKWYGFSLLVILFFLGGCSSGASQFRVQDLAKTDVDLVAELHRQEVTALLKQLNTKLYKRNPAELKKISGATINGRWQVLSQNYTAPMLLPELQGSHGIDAMRLAFDEQFQGDRIFALMAGLVDMLNESYSYKSEFYWLDSIDQQKLYNSARNIEILVWLLHSRENPSGQALILTDSMSAEHLNLSFERLFGKLIAHQDMLALIMAGKTQRTVNTVAHGIVSMTFIPL